MLRPTPSREKLGGPRIRSSLATPSTPDEETRPDRATRPKRNCIEKCALSKELVLQIEQSAFRRRITTARAWKDLRARAPGRMEPERAQMKASGTSSGARGSRRAGGAQRSPARPGALRDDDSRPHRGKKSVRLGGRRGPRPYLSTPRRFSPPPLAHDDARCVALAKIAAERKRRTPRA